MQKKLLGTRMIAGVLGACLIIALIVIWNDQKTIKSLQDPARQNITAQRDLIREACAGTTPADKETCANQLQQLSDLLSEFSKTLPTNTLNKASGGTFKVDGANVQTAPVQ